MEVSFRCSACGRVKDETHAVVLSSCSCWVCVTCLKPHVESLLLSSSQTIVESTFSRVYPNGGHVQYIDQDGKASNAVVVGSEWNGQDWSKSTVTLTDSVSTETTVAGLWRIIPPKHNFSVTAGKHTPCTIPCPGKNCDGVVPVSDVRKVCGSVVDDWNDKAFEASALLGGFIRCPNRGCNALIERLGSNNVDPPLASSGGEISSPRARARCVHKERFRYRCRACDKTFCGLCMEIPYHEGLTCREFRAPKCRFCDERVLGGVDLASLRSSVVREIRRVLKSKRVHFSWCKNKADLLHVAEIVSGVCGGENCNKRLEEICTKRLGCGHACCGVKGEAECPPCVEPGCASRAQGASSSGTFSALDDCQMCWEALQTSPCVQIACGHLMHLKCVKERLRVGYPGPPISFNFLNCPMCGPGERGERGEVALPKPTMTHPLVIREFEKWLKLRDQVAQMAGRRLNTNGGASNAKELEEGGEFHNRPVEYAMKKYMYFECHECKKPYFGGERRCQNAQQNNQEYNRADLVCGGCSALRGGKKCQVHGTSAMDWKCHYCCSIASWFCWGTTHMCDPCHSVARGRGGVNCNGVVANCPLKMAHPPAGTEFCLGCGLCRSNDDV